MSDPTLVILGAGGHGKVCAEIAAEARRYGAIVFSDSKVGRGEQLLSLPIAYHDEDLPALTAHGFEFFIGLGQTATGSMRARLLAWLDGHGLQVASLTAPSAWVSPSARIARGTLVANMALVQASAIIGENCIVNSCALVEHDAMLGDHVHVSTGAIVNGGAQVGDRCLVGSGAVVNQGVEVCADAVVGAGAVVVSDIKSPGVYVGVPARQVSNAR